MAKLTLELLQEQIDELKKEVKMLRENKKGRLVSAGLQVGDTFELSGLDWKIIEIREKGYVCLADKLKESMQFDSSCNNWQASELRNYLNTEFYRQLVDIVGEENIVPFERDLLSLDGQTEYGICEDKVSLLTVDEYRKHRVLISNVGYWWWTITPDSTKCNDDSTWVRVVSSSGGIYSNNFNSNFGVRPVCIFSSTIFESEE